MKFKYIFTTVICFLLIFVNVSADFDISSPAAILIDADTGLTLFSKNENKKMFPASTTKIMTAILAIENSNMEDMASASFASVNSIDFDSSKAGLLEGERVSVRDLLMALIVFSGNDCANVLAEHISGSVENFVKLMNERAAQLGAENTYFTNSHGLHNDNHYTTAKDLAIISRYAMSLPLFKEAVSIRQYTIGPTNKSDESRTLYSTNHLLNPSSIYYYDAATGLKTGYTSRAKSCLVSSASQGGANLIAVVLGSESIDGKIMSFVDSKKILEYGFENFKPQTVISKGDIISSLPIKNAKGTDEVILEAEDTVSIILPQGANIEGLKKMEYIREVVKAPISKGEMMGKMEYWYEGLKLAETNMLAVTNYDKQKFSFVLNIFKSVWLYLIILAVFTVFYIARPKKRRYRRMHYIK